MAGMRKIMPRDYRQVLEATKAALESGEDVDVAVMAVAHG
jgi:glutamate synthase (NADPH/NADH) large chain